MIYPDEQTQLWNRLLTEVFRQFCRLEHWEEHRPTKALLVPSIRRTQERRLCRRTNCWESPSQIRRNWKCRQCWSEEAVEFLSNQNQCLTKCFWMNRCLMFIIFGDSILSDIFAKHGKICCNIENWKKLTYLHSAFSFI